MSGNFSMAEAHILAVLAGVLFGSASISSACWVWLRKQIFAMGGSALCGAGVVLLGLSIWHSVEFGVGTGGMSLKLEAELEQKLRVAEIRSDIIQTDFDRVNDSLIQSRLFIARVAKSTSDVATATAETGRQLVAVLSPTASVTSKQGLEDALKNLTRAVEAADALEATDLRLYERPPDHPTAAARPKPPPLTAQ